jgi:hypothetical protein
VDLVLDIEEPARHRRRPRHRGRGYRCRGPRPPCQSLILDIEYFVLGDEDLVWLKDIEEEVLDVEDVVLDVRDEVLDITASSST